MSVGKSRTSPVVILLSIVFIATALTYLVDSGQFARQDGLVVPVNSIQRTDQGSYIFVASEKDGKDVADRRKI